MMPDQIKSPMAEPGWWVRVATELPMEFLAAVLTQAYADGIITPEIAGQIRKLAMELIDGYQS